MNFLMVQGHEVNYITGVNGNGKIAITTDDSIYQEAVFERIKHKLGTTRCK